MIDWYLSLSRATWKDRIFAAAFAALLLFDLKSEWAALHDDLAIARWIAWSMVAGVVIFMPGILVVLLGGRVPRSFARLPGSLRKTLPQIHADIRHEREHRERHSREF